MFLKKNIYVLILSILSFHLYSQKDSTKVKNEKVEKNLFVQEGLYKPLAPAKAAFYSAIFPGLGQIYNKKYWKAPIVWAALAIPTYYYQTNKRSWFSRRIYFR